MRIAALAGTMAFAILLTGCQNEPEEEPDITEAIPLDAEPDGNAANGSEASDGEENGSVNEPSAPSTMESGSNEGANVYGGEDEGALAPSGSKLQPADPPA